MRFGNPIRVAIEVAAIASVGATTAPRTKPMRQSNPERNQGATRATPSTVKMTSPKARNKILTRL